MIDQDLRDLLCDCLERIETDWQFIEGEIGPHREGGGLEAALARGTDPLIAKLRALVATFPPTA